MALNGLASFCLMSFFVVRTAFYWLMSFGSFIHSEHNIVNNTPSQSVEEDTTISPPTKGKILVTGGAGYIGSHTCVELLNENYDVIVVDSLINSSDESLKRVQELTNKSLIFYKGDILDEKLLERIFSAHKIDAVIHFAALKAVGESFTSSLQYYQNNVNGTLSLLRVMTKYNVKKFVFSSSATVYGNPEKTPITEDFPLKPTNPYGRSKLFIEEILRDLFVSDPEWNIVILRYFNPVGAHPSGKLGEDPKGKPNNLFPYITQVAIGKHPQLSVFGNDYNTPDGTGIRDYIHIIDLAKGHIAAMRSLSTKEPQCRAYNLGTGQGYTVLQIVKAMERASSKVIPYKIMDRRPGDVDILSADTRKAETELNWKAEYNLDSMCVDSWRWQSQNPNGYTQSSSTLPISILSSSSVTPFPSISSLSKSPEKSQVLPSFRLSTLKVSSMVPISSNNILFTKDMSIPCV